MARLTAVATGRGVEVRKDGRTLDRYAADLADRSAPHGVNTDEAEELLERYGYLSQHWTWSDREGGYLTLLQTGAESDARERRVNASGRTNREIGAAYEREIRLDIARTGKRPSGKPLTPEMRQWVADYKRGVRDFGP